MSAQQPADFVHRPTETTIDGLTAEMAGWLASRPEWRALRASARGAHPAVAAYLRAVTDVGHEWRGSVLGTPVENEPEHLPSLRSWVTTREAADSLGLSSTRAVTQAIERQRLNAENVAGRWQIQRTDLEHYRATRVA